MAKLALACAADTIYLSRQIYMLNPKHTNIFTIVCAAHNICLFLPAQHKRIKRHKNTPQR